MHPILVALSARRSALLTAAVTLVAVLYPSLAQGEPVGLVLVLAAAGAAVLGYVTAHAAIGRVEKALAGAVVVGLSSVTAGLEAGLGLAALAASVVLAVAAELGLVPALPSTKGSAARTVQGVVLNVATTTESDEELAKQAARVQAMQRLRDLPIV